MKLRNKKTGEHGEYQVVSAGYLIRVRNCDTNESYQYDCIAGFNDNWEDYKPDEALIKDERIRKAVRAWAEVNGYTKLWVYHDYTTISFYNKDDGDNEITFNTMEKFGLEHLKCYAITELCGEEEE